MENSKEYLLNQINLKQIWNNNQIQNLSSHQNNKILHQTSKSIHQPENTSPQITKEFSIEASMFNFNMNTVENDGIHRKSHVSELKRFFSISPREKKVMSNLNDLFLDNLKKSKKIVNKTLHELMNKNARNEKSTDSRKRGNLFENIKNVVEKQKLSKKSSEEFPLNLSEKNNKHSARLKQKILNYCLDNKSKYIHLGNYEILMKKPKKFPDINENSNSKKPPESFSKSIAKFIVLNGKSDCFNGREKHDKRKSTHHEKKFSNDLRPLKYVSDKIYEEKNKRLLKHQKAFSFHSLCKSPSNGKMP